MNGHTPLLVEKEECLCGRFSLVERLKAHGVRRVSDDTAIHDVATKRCVLMQVSTDIEIGSKCGRFTSNASVHVHVEAVLTSEMHRVAVVKPDSLAVDHDVAVETLLDDPVELWVAQRKVVIHVPLQAVADTRVPVKLCGDSAMIPIFTDDGDPRESAVCFEIPDP